MENVSKHLKTVNSFLKLGLIPVYQFALWLSLKNQSFKKRAIPKVPLCWVGGFRMGGSGKTPFIISLAQQTQEKKIKVLIMAYWINKKGSRLYMKVTSNTSWLETSEEAILLKKATHCDVVVTRNRWKCWEIISKKKDYDLILSDDGATDFRLRKAQGIWLTQPQNQENQNSYFKKWPLGDFRFSSKIILPHHKVVFGPFSRKPSNKSLYFIRKLIFPKDFNFFKKYLVITAIGNPKKFVQDLQTNNVQIQQTYFLRDHQKIHNSFLKNILHSKGKSFLILMTSKDFIKLDNNQKKYCIEIKEAIRTSYSLNMPA